MSVYLPFGLFSYQVLETFQIKKKGWCTNFLDQLPLLKQVLIGVFPGIDFRLCLWYKVQIDQIICSIEQSVTSDLHVGQLGQFFFKKV